MALGPTTALLALATALAGCSVFSTPVVRRAPGERFDGERFVHPWAVPTRAGVGDLLKWQLEREPGEWPDEVPAIPGPPPPPAVDDLRVTFVGHASVLVQIANVNVLTDPVWSERVGPTPWAGPARRRAPGLRFEHLPKIHAVVISHNHYDHLDLPTLTRLWREHRPTFFVGLGGGAILRRAGIPKVRELDWWQGRTLDDRVAIVFVPAQHFSMRWVDDRDRALWGGFVIESPAGRVFFAGDTGYGPHFRAIGERLGPFRLALLPIGAYLPRWFMAPVHIGPTEAVQAHLDLRARTSIPIHFGTFKQADEGYLDPVRDLEAAQRAAGVSAEDFVVLPEGLGFSPRRE